MKILMGLWHLAGYAGTQTWAYTLAREFRKLDHSVCFYSGGKGKMGMRLLGEGFPVYTVGDRLPEVDVSIISQPATFLVCPVCWMACRVVADHIILPHQKGKQDCPGTARNALNKLPKGKRIYVAHGWLDQDRILVDGSPYLTVCQERHDIIQTKHGIDAKVFCQPVDLKRFRPVNHLRFKKPRVLMLSTWPASKEMIQEACDAVGFEFVDREWEAQRWDAEVLINEVDIVLGTGRGICEAMACGRMALVCGKDGCDGVVREENISSLLHHNFSGRATRRTSLEVLTGALQRYDPGALPWNRAEAYALFDASKIAKEILEAI